MKLNRKLGAAVMSVCMALTNVLPGAAVGLNVTYGEAKFYDIATTAYSRMLKYDKGVVPFADQNGKYGLMDAKGNVTVPCQYDGIQLIGSGIYQIFRYNSEESGYYYYAYDSGIMDYTGKVLLPLGTDFYVTEDRGGYICVSNVNKETWEYTYSYYTLDMKPISQETIDGWEYSSEEAELPFDTSAYDYYWTDYNWETGETFYHVFQGENSTLVDGNGVELFPIGTYDDIERLSNGNYIVDNADGRALLDSNKNVLIPAGTYENIYKNWDDIDTLTILGSRNEQGNYAEGCIDMDTGAVIVPLGYYKEIGNMNSDGYVSVMNYEENYDSNLGRWVRSNIVSTLYKDGQAVKTYNGKMVTTEVYYRDLVFSTDGVYNGVMTMDETVLVPALYHSIAVSANGDLVTAIETEPYSYEFTYGLYNADYQQIFENKYAEMRYLTDSKYRVKDGEYYGVYSSADGSAIIPAKYQDMRVYTYDFIELYDGVFYSMVDLNNKVLASKSLSRFQVFKDLNCSLEESIDDTVYNGMKYDGYTDAILPVCYQTEEGYKTMYINYQTGEVENRVNTYASNINKDATFVYRAENGLYGIAKINNMAHMSPNVFIVNGEKISLDAYALLDQNGNPTNYLKLRDIAYLLNGTQAQFSVGYQDGYILINTGEAYTTTDADMVSLFDTNKPYAVANARIKVDGEVVNIDSIILEDNNGGGYTYCQLVSLGKALGFSVVWDNDARVVRIDSPKL